MRAYLEINDFEEQLAEARRSWSRSSGSTSARRSSCGASRSASRRAYKQHKITDEDWRNREKWDAYRAAVNDTVAPAATTSAIPASARASTR